MVTRAEGKRLPEVLHETHLGEGSMIAMARRIWWWPSMSNQIRQLYRNCQVCMLESRAKQRQPPVIPDNLLKLGVFELVGVDLMQLASNMYLVLVDKKTDFRLCEYMKKTATEDVTRVLEQWFL